MNVVELRKMSDDQLKEKIRELSKELLVMRCNHATGQLKNTALLSATRKLIARVKTLLQERNF